MKIAAKLALSQVKLNRHRSIGAISAIVISTALMTAISCFVSSGNAMLLNFLGKGYGDYGEAYKLILLVPALFFGFLIFIMSETVISNVFRTSAIQRMKEFGVIKCVGGTTKQIKETVIYESIWLSIIGIPIGLLLGVGLGYVGVKVTGGFVDEMNTLQQSIVMRPVSFSLSFVVTPIALIFSAIFSFLTVVYSAYKPARKAGKVTALACIRGLGETKIEDNKIHERILIGKILGFEGVLAERNLSRSKYSYRSTIRSLSIGILLILSTVSLVLQARKIEDYMDPGTEDVMVDYCSSRERNINEITGREEEIIHKPIHSKIAEQVTKKLSEYGDIDIMGVGVDNSTYYALMDTRFLTQDMKEGVGANSKESCELEVDLIVLDQKNYESLCQIAGVSVGSSILLNYYKYNDNGYLQEIIPFEEELKELKLQKANGEVTVITVEGFLQKEAIPKHVIGVNESPVRLVVPEAEVRFYDWYCKPVNENEYMTYARSIIDEFFPTHTDDSYAKEGFTVRISRVDTMVKVLNISIVIAQVVLYGFVLLLLMIGLVSVISTFSTNVLVRAREFAVLKSVGMTAAGLQKMLINESLICTIKATIWGVPFGLLIPFSINLAIRKMLPVRYEIPWILLIISVISIFLLIILITFAAIRKLKKQNLIETIRMETM